MFESVVIIVDVVSFYLISFLLLLPLALKTVELSRIRCDNVVKRNSGPLGSRSLLESVFYLDSSTLGRSV